MKAESRVNAKETRDASIQKNWRSKSQDTAHAQLAQPFTVGQPAFPVAVAFFSSFDYCPAHAAHKKVENALRADCSGSPVSHAPPFHHLRLTSSRRSRSSQVSTADGDGLHLPVASCQLPSCPVAQLSSCQKAEGRLLLRKAGRETSTPVARSHGHWHSARGPHIRRWLADGVFLMHDPSQAPRSAPSALS